MNKHYFGKLQYYLVVILMTLFSTISFGQAGQYDTTKWKFSNPKQFGFTIQDVDFFDNNNVIAVGSDGGIARSTDGGSNWTYGPFTYTNAAGFTVKPIFNDVHFISATTAYAVGASGVMVKTVDGGVTWSFLTTPLYAGARNINTCWFLDANKGYIGGQFNSPDSIPKIYVTNNGGSTWDSLAAPVVNGTTKVGFINNATYPSIDYPITAKAKEIQRIIFLNNSIGYVVGGGSSLFPNLGIPNITNATTCAFTGTQTTGSYNASLLWKFDNGTLTDYSISKERLGYTGFPATINCTSKFGSVTQTVQQYRALNIINDSLIVILSFNNNIVIKVATGKNDSTQNINRPGVYEKGRFEILNTGPGGPPPGYPQIPATQVLFASNPYQLKNAANGKLYAAANFANLWTSIDTGRNWIQEKSLPQGQNYSNYATWALDIAPNGKFLSMGALGVVADSVPGSTWKSNYLTTPASAAYIKLDFPDCNNGMAAGSANITVTTDGGKTWIDKTRADFAASFYSINGMTYPTPSKAYFAVTNGTVYFSADQGTTLDPIFADPLMQMNDVTTVGDSIWAVGYSSFSVPTASRTSKIYRSVDNGVNWITYSGFTTGSLAQNFTDIEFPTRLVGYVAGNRDTIYKTTDGGVTWNKLPLPTPSVTPAITYRDLFALDANTVFLVGNGFPRKSVIKTTDGGATWVDISGNIGTLGLGNLTGIVMHDVNNGYIVSPGLMVRTTDGGTTWIVEAPPTNCLFETVAFAPRSAPAGTNMASRRLFVTGANISGAPLMEFGVPSIVNVSSTETITGSCANGSSGSIVVTATGGIAPYSYSIDGTTFQTSNTFSGLTAGIKTITIKDNGCQTVAKPVTVGILPNPVVSAGPDKTILDGVQIQLSGSGSSNVTSIAWTPAATLIAANTYTPYAQPTNTTIYTLTVQDANGCISTDNTLVTVIPYCVKVMTAFTPNGDGINDKWLVTSGRACIDNVVARVFNRYGSDVFTSNNYNNDWDGTYNGKPVPDGTYYYVINFKLISGRVVQATGNVTILR